MYVLDEHGDVYARHRHVFEYVHLSGIVSTKIRLRIEGEITYWVRSVTLRLSIPRDRREVGHQSSI